MYVCTFIAGYKAGSHIHNNIDGNIVLKFLSLISSESYVAIVALSHLRNAIGDLNFQSERQRALPENT